MKKFFVVVAFICIIFLSGGYGYTETPIKAPIKGVIQIPPEIARAVNISEIKPFLESSDGRIKIAAVRRLVQIGDKDAVGILIKVFENEPAGAFPYVKEEIIKALGEIGGKEAKSSLFKFLKEYLKKGPPGALDDDYFYLNEVNSLAQSLSNLYDPKEYEEIYNFFKPIALGESKDEFIMENDTLRRKAYKIYLKTEIYKKNLTAQETIKYLEEFHKSYIEETRKPSWNSGWESPGIRSQKAIEGSVVGELLREYRRYK